MSDHSVPASIEGTFKSYLTGFILSIVLTLIAFALVYAPFLQSTHLLFALIALAVAQFVVQMVFFLHIWHDTKPHWNAIAFVFMLVVVVILVWGTLWIMYHLDYRMMPHMSHS
jgi:cytochrome o ubiquinol oxidase operon protein cyoD